ncbi:MAG: hypothetical protein LBL46_00810 [Rickettsiales bacterium]|jgi:hypothetical protein|nr:hypothetical protein [Rickettsiales bacterium]
MNAKLDFNLMKSLAEFDFGDGIPMFYMGSALHHSGQRVHIIKKAFDCKENPPFTPIKRGVMDVKIWFPPADNRSFTAIADGGNYSGEWFASARLALRAAVEHKERVKKLTDYKITAKDYNRRASTIQMYLRAYKIIPTCPAPPIVKGREPSELEISYLLTHQSQIFTDSARVLGDEFRGDGYDDRGQIERIRKYLTIRRLVPSFARGLVFGR